LCGETSVDTIGPNTAMKTMGRSAWTLIAGVAVLCLTHALELCQAEEKKHPTEIVVLAQGRSGSSFVSWWFGAHPNVTYFLEPCSVTYINGVYRDKTGTGCASIVHQLARCDFSAVALDRNISQFVPDVAKGFKGWGHQRGEDDLLNCKHRTATATKELRMGVAWAENKASFEKVIVLLRDPRAVVNSRQKEWPQRNKKRNDWQAEPTGWDGKRGFPYDQSLKSLCLEQTKLRERARTSPKSEVMLVEYVEVLRDPKDLLTRVMEFVGLELVPEVSAFVEKNTKGNCEHADLPFSVCRSALPRKDDKWKKTLPQNQLDELMATPECAAVIQQYYSSEDVQEKEEL
jgi:hypothetical protein